MSNFNFDEFKGIPIRINKAQEPQLSDCHSLKAHCDRPAQVDTCRFHSGGFLAAPRAIGRPRMCELKAMDAHSYAIWRLCHTGSYCYCIICYTMPCQCFVSALSRISLPLRVRSRGCGLKKWCNLFAVDTAGGPGSTGAAGSPAWCSGAGHLAGVVLEPMRLFFGNYRCLIHDNIYVHVFFT